MKILITGAKGFIGKNLVAELSQKKYEHFELFLFDMGSEIGLLDQYAKECDFVIHLAGVNRPEKIEDFMTGNFGFASILLEKLLHYENSAPILITSSIHAALNTPYGISKKAGEDLIFAYGKTNNIPVYVFRMPNVFGKWCRPNYNSVVATFCHNIANNLPIVVNDSNTKLTLVHVDDVVSAIIAAIDKKVIMEKDFCIIKPDFEVTLGEIVSLLISFKDSRKTLAIPNMSDEFTKKLYATYLTYLSEDQFAYDLQMNVDNRGSFTEFAKTINNGQVSVNISKPGIIKGNHYHNLKNEKFLVVSGIGVIRFRKINDDNIIEYHVSGEKLQVVDIPPGYTHNIENLGKTDLVTIMWANEKFDPNNPDTIYMEV